VTTNSQPRQHSLETEGLHDFYTQRGFSGRVGFGERPAVLVIDLARAWTEPFPASPLGSGLSAVIQQICKILRVARQIPLPVFFTTMEFDADGRDAGAVVALKTPHIAINARGSEWNQLHPALERQPHEVLIAKQRASAFHGTTLLSQLIAQSIDTLIVTGCSTSGCIRATAQDGFDYDFHVIVPREAVGDRSPSAHEANLFDIDARLGDVLPVEHVLRHLEQVVAARATPPL
jgi:maleamate amidohydrolase